MQDLELREPSNYDIDMWLRILSPELGFFTVNRPEYDHWQLYAQNSAAPYNLDVYDQNIWLTYGTVLVHDVNEGQGPGDFYGGLLDLSAQLNGAHISRADGFLILTREQRKFGLSISSLAESLLIMNSAHELIFPKVLGLIASLNVTKN